MRAQRIDEQIRLRGEVRVQRPVAHACGCRDIGHARAVVPARREDLSGSEQQPLTSIGGGDACDATHSQIKRAFI
jgi:hypothetical protein